MSFFQEIRKQPLAFRRVMFVLSVVTVVSLSGVIWFNSFERDIFALMNPEEEFEGRFYADGKPPQILPLALIGKGAESLKAAISTLLNIDLGGATKVKGIDHSDDKVYIFPLSGDK